MLLGTILKVFLSMIASLVVVFGLAFIFTIPYEQALRIVKKICLAENPRLEDMLMEIFGMCIAVTTLVAITALVLLLFFIWGWV